MYSQPNSASIVLGMTLIQTGRVQRIKIIHGTRESNQRDTIQLYPLLKSLHQHPLCDSLWLFSVTKAESPTARPSAR